MKNSTWAADSGGNIWNDGTNWSAGTVPSENASFGHSNVTMIGFDPASHASIETVSFEPDAPAYSFTIGDLAKTPALTLTGAGIENSANTVQSFRVMSLGTYNQPQLKFTGEASAGNSQTHYYAGPPDLEKSYGGGTIAFHDASNAGAASFTVRTGKQKPPDRSSTLGGQITFHDNARAGIATFSIYGTLGTDGDTFANAVFHDTTSAGRAVFTNHGGTVPGGDGGNTQFYDYSSAADGVYLNFGGSAFADGHGANGGDVAFDGLATGENGRFNNYPASVAGAGGGVTSFNNNPNYPSMNNQGASAGAGTYLNYGATEDFPGGGGHTELTARYGFATAGKATFYNFGAEIAEAGGAGHTSFSIGSPYASKSKGGEPSDPVTEFFPTAAEAKIWNLPGRAGGFTVFKVFDGVVQHNQPTAGYAVIQNLGGDAPGIQGGYTLFQNTTTAGKATLIAQGGTNGGKGGQIVFQDQATGGTAHVHLSGDGTLDISGHDTGVTLGALETEGGVIATTLRPDHTALALTEKLTMTGAVMTFEFVIAKGSNLITSHAYQVLQATNLDDFDMTRFTANDIGTVTPRFELTDGVLMVVYT